MIYQKLVSVLLVVIFLAGCATTSETISRKIDVTRKHGVISPIDTSPQLQNIAGEDLEQYAQKKGVIFAKTDFSGVLATSYVRLLMENLDDVSEKFQIYIGDKEQPKTLSWDVKTVKPGYFFIELPIGSYKISSVSIPVGSTLATEPLDIRFEVLPDTIAYIGTLKMVGTKEKIRLGGVPVIKPGFEFTTQIVDEVEEGKNIFHQDYPNVKGPIKINLMKINAATGS